MVFLDEPTIGMDIVVKQQVREFLRHLVKARGHTVVLTTHDMLDVEQLCDRVLLIAYGRVSFDGTINQLRARGATSEPEEDQGSLEDLVARLYRNAGRG